MVAHLMHGGLTGPVCERGLILISAPASSAGAETTMEVVRTRSPGASSYQAHMLQLSSWVRLS